MDYKRVLVTSALPYANGPLHLGHIAGAYLPADIFVRFCRMSGRDVLYVGGTDEHGVAITLAADRQGVHPREIVDKWYVNIRDNFERLGISFDNFSRTTLPVHHQTSQDFFRKIYDQDLLVEKTEKQLFDSKAGRYLPDRYVEGTCYYCGKDANGDQCESCGKPIDPLKLINPKSKLTGETPVEKETTHWYMPLDKFQGKLENWLAGKDYWKDNVMTFCRGYLKEGLKERACTRDLDWGIPVPLPNTEGKVLYVWFDAPIGYISSTKEWAEKKGDPELWKTYWQDEGTRLVHFIGKDNIFFHALMFPAVLMAYGDYVLPENVPANEYLNLEGLKFSTSRNFAVWLHDYLDRFEPDPLRYYLCANMPENRDTDFSLKEFQAHNNNELADTVGNFINRTLTFVGRYFDGSVPARGSLSELDNQMIEALGKVVPTVGEKIDTFRFREAADSFAEFLRFCNKYFNDKAPWASRKDNLADCATTLNICVNAVYAASVAMYPIMPFSAIKIWKQLGLSEDFKDHRWQQDFAARLKEGDKLGEAEVLFPKIEDKLIDPVLEELARAREGGSGAAKVEQPPLQEEITYDDFAKLDIRVAQVKEAEKVKKSKKLLKLTLDVGALGTRTVAAGISQHYEPEELVGRKVLLLANLAPRQVMGIESQGMVLAATSGELLAHTMFDSAKADLPPGSKIS